MNRTVLFAGVLVTSIVIGLLFLGLGKNPNEIRSPLIGQSAPAFALRETGTQRSIDVTTLRGRPMVINFWATWCGPCWEEHPVLVDGARKHQDIQFLGVVFQDSEDKILGFLQQRGTAYPTVVDDRGKTAIAYGVAGVPETFFVDAEGVIVAKYSGPLNSEDLERELLKVARP